MWARQERVPAIQLIEQRGERYVECLGQPHKRVRRRGVLSALRPGYRHDVDPCLLRKLRLGEVALLPQFPDVAPDLLPHYLLRVEFKGHGCKLKALNDIGDESPEGELSDGVVDLIAKYERARIASRTAEGKYRKAREGKIPGTGTPPLGFRYEAGHYFVVEEEMSLVRDIFQRVADGQSLNGVVNHLQKIGTPTPGGGEKWHRTTLRTLIFNDTYDGVYYYGRSRKRRTPVVKMVDGEKVYSYKTETEEHPREEWIPISVPDSGIPSETIQRARQRIEGNTWTPSNNNGLTWELSGGVGLCGYCGSRLRTRSPNNSTRKYFYYTCLNESCPFNKHYRKQELERRVGELLADTLRPDTWTEFVEKTINQKIADLKRRHRSLLRAVRDYSSG